MWDRKCNADVKSESLDAEYSEYMLKQLDELIDMTQKHTKIVEFWFDGGWLKSNNRWPLEEIYETIKRKAPQCQVGINWSIGEPGNADKHLVLPEHQEEGFPIRYFPSDFRLGDPYLPKNPDPKLFTQNDKTYYMPWESTVCMSDKWFYHTEDHTYKSIDELVRLFNITTSQDNILILNCPPNKEGKIRDKDIELLMELRKQIKL